MENNHSVVCLCAENTAANTLLFFPAFPSSLTPRMLGKEELCGAVRLPLPKCQVQATSLEAGGLTSLAAVSLASNDNEGTKYCVKKK